MNAMWLCCHVAASDLGRVGSRTPRKSSIRSAVRVIIDAVSGFSSVSCLETWRIPVPQIRDRLHRIELRSPNSHPGDRIGRIEPRSPDGSPRRTHSQRLERLCRFGPSDTLVGALPCAPAGSSRLRHDYGVVEPLLHHAPVCDEVFVDWPLPRRSFPGRCTTDYLGRAASSSSPT